VIVPKQIFSLCVALALTSIAQAQTAPTLQTELSTLKTDLALLVNSSAVEERSLWSPQSDYVACRLLGKWMKIPLTNVELKEGQWQGQKAGLLKNPTLMRELNESELKLFRAASEVQPIVIRTKAGTVYSLRPNGSGMALVAKGNNGESRQLWSSGTEACHSLSLSPDEKYLSCLCEQSGLLLTKIE
jgi:hypothetical protein